MASYTDKSRKRQKQISTLLEEKNILLRNYEKRKYDLSKRLNNELDLIHKSYLGLIKINVFDGDDIKSLKISYNNEIYSLCDVSFSTENVYLTSYGSNWRDPNELEYTDLVFKYLSNVNTFLMEYKVDYLAELKEKRTEYSIFSEPFTQAIKELNEEISSLETELQEIKDDLKLAPGLTYEFYWNAKFAKRYNGSDLRSNYVRIKTVTFKKLTKTAVYFEMFDDNNNLRFSMRKKKSIMLDFLNRENGKLTKECLRKQKLKGIFAEI